MEDPYSHKITLSVPLRMHLSILVLVITTKRKKKNSVFYDNDDDSYPLRRSSYLIFL